MPIVSAAARTTTTWRVGVAPKSIFSASGSGRERAPRAGLLQNGEGRNRTRRHHDFQGPVKRVSGRTKGLQIQGRSATRRCRFDSTSGEFLTSCSGLYVLGLTVGGSDLFV